MRGELAEAGNTAPLAELIDDLRAGGVRALAPNGVLGDPRGASVAEGEALLAAAVEDLCATIRAWDDAPRREVPLPRRSSSAGERASAGAGAGAA